MDTKPTIPATVRNVLDTLAKTGTPREALKTLEAFAIRDGEIKSQQFRAEKERAGLDELKAHVVKELAAYPTTIEAEAAKERDTELARVDNELTHANAIPNRDLGESDAAYAAKLHRHAITEARTHAAIVAASADVTLALSIDDATELEAIAREALEGGSAEHIRRVARAVSLRLNRLAVIEEQQNKTPGSARPATEASHRINALVTQWRAKEATNSPEARRQQIVARYQQRVTEARTAIARAASASTAHGVD